MFNSVDYRSTPRFLGVNCFYDLLQARESDSECAILRSEFFFLGGFLSIYFRQ